MKGRSGICDLKFRICNSARSENIMTQRFGTVDADGHLEENHIDWKDRLPDRYKSKAPERRDSGNGQLRTIIEGKPWPRPSGLGIGVGGPYSRPHPPSRDDGSESAPGRHGQ